MKAEGEVSGNGRDIADAARAVVAKWPTLTAEQRERLTDLLSPYAPKRGEVRRAA